MRFIGNHSSGKMGFKIAQEFLNRGAKVTLVTGPTKLTLENDQLDLIKIRSAEQMLSAVQNVWEDCDLGVFAAAVADYRPKNEATEKIKKKSDDLTIELVKNPDILNWAGQQKRDNQYLVGFALETENLKENATKKLIKKNLNMIVMNSLKDSGAGFGVDTNKISILDNRNNLQSFELKPKEAVAKDILDYLKTYIG